MLLTGKKTAIIGAGPGGLTLARLLQQQGADVTIYERDADRHARQQGATLDLHEESGLRALDAAGLLDEFRTHYRPGADKLRLTDAQAVIHFDQHQETSSADFGHAHFRPEIDRGPLRDLLIDSLQPGTIVWNCQLQSLEPAAEGWQLQFRDGRRVYADLVVGADGANSKVRAQVTPLPPFFTGFTLVEGNVYDAARQTPTLWELVRGGKVFAFEGEQSIILSAKGDGSLAFYTCQPSTQDWVATSGIDFHDSAQVAAWFARDFAAWSPVWQELFATAAYFVPRPQYCMPLDQHWPAQPGITLLGDAAHLMPPYAGEGVNMAMLDALELSECLTNTGFSSAREAIGHYETAMRARAAEAADMSIVSMERLHSAGALAWMEQMMSGPVE
ncbi:FAD-dependent oxidoreductase [Hymenobacter chitinivorans]|uniref:Flavin-dependent monooxygenase n=1 Tax=Hymenobacter chitinivorans DSM 11115 TaxID=1121954 RepID=A0A2M9BQG3_9BACT|nr:NAD(P)/FAD-dependent oxidoreductase [Hymenobacter chitinivorans]PJJ60196.1 2-polyprenyl-6-methoxyphenol hydroxylase-like FAD-dependent oxidoreductase [Hymenobacter chitinivorans DSM 11115]